jgi:hypothetical protein
MSEARRVLRCTAFVILAAFAACSSGSSGGEEVTVDFTLGAQGWIAGFADYPVGQESFYELDSGYRALPSPLDGMGSALYIAGNNHSDDLFMFYKGKVGGLEPGRTYRAEFRLEFATNVPRGCSGIGGSPGESVYAKAGASTTEPEAVNSGGTYRMNVDKGQQSNGGANAAVLGDMAGSQECTSATQPWETKEVSGGGAVEVTADAEGSLWLFMGTDSGFEGKTTLYFTRITAILD